MGNDPYSKKKELVKALYQKHHRKLWAFALRHVKDPAVAEDMVHDTFLKFWESKQEYATRENLAPLLFTILRNLLVNHYRRSVLENKVISLLPDPHNEASGTDQEKIQALRAAIEGLPPKRRQIFKMSKQQGMTYEEIAEELSISKNTVEVHLVKAYKFLRQKLKDSRS